MSREAIILNNPLLEFCHKRGMEFKKQGVELYASCPFHADGSRPNFRLNESKETWFCDVCGIGGSVIDLVMHLDKCSVKEAMGKLSGEEPKPVSILPSPKETLVAEYDYLDANGNLVYQALRYTPKTFRQRRPDGNGGWKWDMNGVERVLFNLPKVIKSPIVFIVEGEKDALNLINFGVTATTNVGGAGKWLDAYNVHLRSKDVILCGDNDPKGQEHIQKILISLGDYPKSVRILKVPQPFKDVSEWLDSNPDRKEIINEIISKAESSEVVRGYEKLPIKNMTELEEGYMKFAKETHQVSFNLSMFLPDLGRYVRPLVPGELLVIAADTGSGKTIILQNMAIRAKPLDVLVFQLELPATLDFERFVSCSNGIASSEVYRFYSEGMAVNWRATGRLNHINICSLSGIGLARIKELILLSELKIGKRPDLVIIDYIQLIRGEGKTRYERFSNVAEDLKVIAKDLNIILIVASQVGRKEGKTSPEIYLHDCKESGSIENSCGVLLGCWRDLEDEKILKIKILKNTKGIPGRVVECEIDGETKTIKPK